MILQEEELLGEQNKIVTQNIIYKLSSKAGGGWNESEGVGYIF